MTKIDKIVANPKSDLSIKSRSELKDFAKKIETRLKMYFEKQLSEPFGVNEAQTKLTKQIWKHIRSHNLNPAKRLRAAFFVHGYKLFKNTEDESILDASMSIELIHTALLMHDDFMDLDEMRRGFPTTHEHFKNYHIKNYKSGDAKHYGYGMALLAGDIGMLSGYKILSESNFDSKVKIKALNRLLEGIANTGFGQAYDVTLESIGKANENDILSLHHAKTSIYTYENPLHIGAILAEAKDNQLKLLSDYAIPGGIAFQLQDDILGIYGDSDKTGKPDYSDIKQGKVTLLYIKALQNASESQKKDLQKYYGKRDLTSDEAEIVRKIIIDTGSLEYSKKISLKYAKNALKAIRPMRDKNWNRESLDFLEGIAQYMVERDV